MLQFKKPLAIMVFHRRLGSDGFPHSEKHISQALRMLFVTTWTSRRHRTDLAAMRCLGLMRQMLCVPMWSSGWARAMGRCR